MFESKNKIEYPKEPNTPISPDHYFKIMTQIFENIGENSPLHEMGFKLCQSLQISVGPSSALTRNNFDAKSQKEKYEEAREKDKIIGTVFANIPGVYVDMGKNELQETAPIVTMDINKILDVLESGQGGIGVQFEEFMFALPEKDRNIIKSERELRKNKKDFNGDRNFLNFPLVYFRLLGGVGVFLRGYRHDPQGIWQKNYGTELIDIYADNSSLILIEGYADSSIGESLEKLWQRDLPGYSTLMKAIACKNSDILFGEVDGRNMRKVKMDGEKVTNNIYTWAAFVSLPSEFYENYYSYLVKLNPGLGEKIKDPQELKNFLKSQSVSIEGNLPRDFSIDDQNINTKFQQQQHIDAGGQSSSHMTGFELGQTIYADALSAIKLHLLAKLSSYGYLPTGPIVDFQGSDHISSKTFFMQYPQYAMMVVLMNIHELMAGNVEKLETNDDTAVAYSRKIFKNPNFEDIIKEILKLPIFAIEKDPNKTAELGPNQKALIDKTPDFTSIYNIDIAKLAREIENLLSS